MVGGNLIDYPNKVSTPTADLVTAKCIINSTLSTPNARCLTANIKDFYLNTPMSCYEYMKLPVHMIPQEIMEQYKLHELAHKDFIYIEIRKGMYGLPQAGLIAKQKLIKHLAPFGYAPTTHTPGLWKHLHSPL